MQEAEAQRHSIAVSAEMALHAARMADLQAQVLSLVTEALVKKEAEAAVVEEKIRLDVGGKAFSVNLAMMRRFPDSYFGEMFGRGRWQEHIGSDGTIFINREPKVSGFGRNSQRI
jgi:hypothetical protein